MPSELVEEKGMEAIAHDESINKRKLKQRDRVSTAELYAAIEGLLPFAETEISWLNEMVREMPEDPDHAADCVRAQKGNEALELTRRLIARKSGNIRRKQRALGEKQGQADA